MARLGMQFWTFGFCFFLLKSIEDLPLIQKASLVLCLALVPQLVFVQSYVNLDSLGLAVFAYLLWSVKTRKERHLAFGVFLLSCCKMNFFCLLVIPLAYLLWNFRQQKKVLFRKMILLIALPFSALFVWLFFSYWVNTRPYGSFLGFDVLVQLYPSPPSRFRVFTLDFVNMSLASAFGRFGWMNLRMPEFLYFFWRCLILPAGIVFLWRNLKKGTDSQARFVAITCLMIIVLNLITHTWFSFNNEYQPQGRYLFPTVLILLSYLVMGLLREPVSAARKRWCVALCFFMMISSLGGIFIAAKTTNKPKGLATTWNSPQKNSTEY
ncbi:DUF2142 domain-containing protein [bacterium]|nr:DUF2142 domain-containing protein [bacterium]